MRTTIIDGRTVRLRELRFPPGINRYFDPAPLTCVCGSRKWRHASYVTSAAAVYRKLGAGHTTRHLTVCASCGLSEWQSYHAAFRLRHTTDPATPPEPLHPGLAARRHDPERAERRARRHRERQGKGRR